MFFGNVMMFVLVKFADEGKEVFFKGFFGQREAPLLFYDANHNTILKLEERFSYLWF